MSESLTEVDIRGWGWKTQSFALTKDGIQTVYTLDRKTTQLLAEILAYRAQRMVDEGTDER